MSNVKSKVVILSSFVAFLQYTKFRKMSLKRQKSLKGLGLKYKFSK